MCCCRCGGGISNSGTLTINRSTFSGNGEHPSQGTTRWGGAIFHGAVIFNPTFNTLTVRNSTFEGNDAASGGGIFMYPGSFGSLTHSTFSENHADFGGGGIGNFGTLTVDHSTLSGNNTAGQGGGILNAGPLAVAHSTITQNSAGIAGGGIYTCVEGQVDPTHTIPFGFEPCHGTLTLTHTSVTENTPDDIFPW